MLWGEILSPFCSENGLLCLFASFPKVFPKRCYSRRGCKQGLMQWFTWLQCVGLLPLDSFGCSTQGSNHCGCQSGGTSDIWQLLLSRDHESILHCKQLNKQKKSSFALPSLQFSLQFALFFLHLFLSSPLTKPRIQDVNLIESMFYSAVVKGGRDVFLCILCTSLGASAPHQVGAIHMAQALPRSPMGISSLTAALQLQDAKNHTPGLPNCQKMSNRCACKSQ